MIATHDSLTGYKAKYWILNIFNFMSKCQNKTLEEQYNAGARSFDLRFLYHRKKWYGAHGIQIYDITLDEVLETLNNLSTKEDPIYFRVLCEDAIIKSDLHSLCDAILNWLSNNPNTTLKPLYINSKKTWELGYEWDYVKETANYDIYSNMSNDRKTIAFLVSNMYELKTTDDKINFIGCYVSGGNRDKYGLPYPKTAADALTPIVLTKKWKPNDCPVVDFI